MIDGFNIEEGLIFRQRLRFDLDYLKIRYNNQWKNIPKFETEVEYELDSGKTRKQYVELTDILFDTGNEAGYCALKSSYKELFEQEFPKIKIIGKNRNLALTEVKQDFLFNDIILFRSKIGFRSDGGFSWHDRINIGIDSITQFINLIYPTDTGNSECSYLCFLPD